MKGDYVIIQDLLDSALNKDLNQKIEKLKTILDFNCDDQFKILIRKIITYFRRITQNDENIIQFRKQFMIFANKDWNKDED